MTRLTQRRRSVASLKNDGVDGSKSWQSMLVHL